MAGYWPRPYLLRLWTKTDAIKEFFIYGKNTVFLRDAADSG